MRIAVTGATGALGRPLVAALLARGDDVTVLTRDPDRARAVLGEHVTAVAWPEPKRTAAPADALAGRAAAINLLGEPIAQRWTAAARAEIRDSRVLGTRNLVAALGALAPDERPAALVSQSGSGFYGPRGSEPVAEDGPAGTDFLAAVCRAWEEEALAAAALGVRVALTRTGVVLAESGGALEKMLPPFKLGVGGPVAGGRQYVPWVHADDVVGALAFCAGEPAASGPVNVCAPEPATNAELSRALGRVLRRPAVVPVPGLALRLLYGQMAEIVTTGVRAVPARLLELGYRFRQPRLEPALRLATGRR